MTEMEEKDNIKKGREGGRERERRGSESQR